MIPGNPFEKSNSHAHLDTIFESVKRQVNMNIIIIVYIE